MPYYHMNPEEYERTQSVILPLQIQVSEYTGKLITDIRWYDYVLYSKEVMGYYYQYHDFGNIVGTRFFGSTRFIEDEVVITINTHSSQSNERIHFTTMHELAHAYYHLQEHPDSTFISGVRNLDREEKVIENEADMIAGNMMISDKAIFKAMESGTSFSKMVKEFECSHSSLFVRLKNYLIYTVKLNPTSSLELVNNYRYRASKDLFDFVIGLERVSYDYHSGDDDLMELIYTPNDPSEMIDSISVIYGTSNKISRLISLYLISAHVGVF